MSAIRKRHETFKNLVRSNYVSRAPIAQPFGRQLLSKQELAMAIGVSPRTIDSLIPEKRIPFLRLSSRMIRFNLERVRIALARYEVREIGSWR
jgi:hypothetical protein